MICDLLMDHSRALSSPGKPGGDGSAGPGTAAEPTEPALGSGWEGRALSEALKHFFFSGGKPEFTSCCN